jgi:hypothetical protein
MYNQFARTLGALAFVAALPAAASAQGVPGTVNFTARIDGLPQGDDVQEALSLTFRLFDTNTGGTEAWSETHQAVDVVDGLIFVELGTYVPLDSVVFDGKMKWLEISVGGTTMSPRLSIASVPYAIRAGAADMADHLGSLDADDVALVGHKHEAASVPIGSVISWWRPDSSVPIPDGYRACDGSMIDDPESPYDGHVLPDLTNRFVLGVVPEDVGAQGGSASHGHSVSVASAGSHNHSGSTSSAGSHAHSGSTSTAGSHVHGLNARTGSVAYGGATPGKHSYHVLDDNRGWGSSEQHLQTDGGASSQEGQHRHSLGGSTYSAGSHGHSVSTSSTGSHAHSFSTSTKGSHAHSASAASSTQLQPYVGLLMIMRVR